MRPALLIVIVLTALVVSACSTNPSQAGHLDGPLTTITIATASASTDVDTLGVPFVDGVAVVESVAVSVFGVDDLLDPVELRFSFADGVYSFDPDGAISSISFAFDGAITVALPAGHAFAFLTSGFDGADTWMAYGMTLADVDYTTSSVRLVLETMIEEAVLDTAGDVHAVVLGESIDLFLTVSSPGGYAVPIDDFAVSYALAAGDGVVTGASNLGARVTATDTLGHDVFTLTASVTGWRNVQGFAVWSDGVSATFEKPYAIDTGLGLDAKAPTVTIDAVLGAAVGTTAALGGEAMDDIGVTRVQVYEGPVLIGSSDPFEFGVEGVGSISVVNEAWSMGWTPARVGAHTVTVVAFDAAGNEGRSSTTVDVGEPLKTTLTFVGVNAATLAAGETVILQGPAFSGFTESDPRLIFFSKLDYIGHDVSKAGLTIVGDTWTLEWTAPTVAGEYGIEYIYNGEPATHYSLVEITVQ